MQLIKECKLLWQNEHVAKMSKSAHHQKMHFLGLEIDITKARFRFGFISISSQFVVFGGLL